MSAVDCPVVSRTTGDTPGAILGMAAGPRSAAQPDFESISAASDAVDSRRDSFGTFPRLAPRFAIGCPSLLCPPQESLHRRPEV